MFTTLLDELKLTEEQSPSILIKELVASVDENTPDSTKEEIANFALSKNLSFLVPSEWFNLGAFVKALPYIQFSPSSEIEDVIEMAISSPSVLVISPDETKMFDTSLIEHVDYFEEGGKVFIENELPAQLYDLLFYISLLFSKQGVNVPLSSVTISDGENSMTISPDEEPVFAVYKSISKANARICKDNLGIPFGDVFISNREFMTTVQEKLAPFGALVGILQNGFITINLESQFVPIIFPVLSILGLDIFSDFELKDGSTILICSRIAPDATLSFEDAILNLQSILNS